ncbi:MAG: SDR family oxidoreductase [Candidatus Riflebacteria bacterium]|nr:SDR family oxidoreductase [Candidatus Riflebacteria bacterium]
MTTDRYLVTGGAGFIGSHLVHALVARGLQVRVLDNFSTGKRENLAGLDREIELTNGDIRDPDTVTRVMVGVTHVLHQAALPSVARSVANPRESHEVNASGTLSLLLAARDAGARRFVYASSSSAYGGSPELPKLESMPTRPRSPYAVSKLAAEQYCRVYHELFGVETVSLRYFHVFGPRQDPGSPYSAVIPRFITAHLKGERPVVHGDGGQTRDFTYVENVVHANLLAAAVPGVGGTVFNVGCGERISLLDLLSALGDLTGNHPEPIFESPRPGDVRDSLADIGQARARLGYEPIVPLSEGLRRTVAFFGRPEPGRHDPVPVGSAPVMN